MLREWCDAQQHVYTAFFEPLGVQTLTGRVTSVTEDEAVLSDSVLEMKLPLSDVVDALFTRWPEGSANIRSITLAWANGTSAFIVVR